MLTYEEALAVAKKAKADINHCVEYSNAYMFSHDTGEDSDGGDSPVVVLKENGDTMSMSTYMWTPGKDFMRAFPVE